MKFGAITAALYSAVTAWLGLGGAVQAQDGLFFQRDRNVSVLDRPRREYDAPGFREGPFIVRPSVELGLEYDTNIFSTGSNDESDFIAIFSPEVELESTWSRHKVMADAMVERRQYFDFSDESVWNGSLGAGGRLDIQRGFYAEAGVRRSRMTEDRSSAAVLVAAAEPVRFDTSSVFAGLVRESGRIRLEGRVEFDAFDFDDVPLNGGGVGDQDFRDRDEVRFVARADAAVTPDTSLFGRLTINDRDYDLAPPLAVLDRSSSGHTVDAGADFDIGGLARGEVALGYTEQEYNSAAIPNVDGLSVNAAVEWFPTPLTTVTLGAKRGIEDSAIPGSGAFVATSASAQVDHELLRNLIFTGRVNFGDDEYEGIDRTDERFEVLASAVYLANRNVGFRASVSRLDEQSSGAASRADFDETKVMFSVELRI